MAWKLSYVVHGQKLWGLFDFHCLVQEISQTPPNVRHLTETFRLGNLTCPVVQSFSPPPRGFVWYSGLKLNRLRTTDPCTHCNSAWLSTTRPSLPAAVIFVSALLWKFTIHSWKNYQINDRTMFFGSVRVPLWLLKVQRPSDCNLQVIPERQGCL